MYVLVLELVCVNAVDLVIVLDLAGTAPTTADFTTYKNFVSNFIRNFDHSSTAVQIGLIVAGDGVATNVFYLDTSIGNEDAMVAEVEALTFLGDQFDVSAAVALARDNQFTSGNGDRDDAVNVIVTIVDEISTLNSGNVLTESNAAQANGIVMLSIGVGTQYQSSSSIETTELRWLSSEPRVMNINYYPVTSYNSLEGIRRSVVDSVCEAVSPPSVGMLTSRSQRCSVPFVFAPD